MRRAADRIRITAQLIDAKSGGHAWAERYDRDLKDVFGVQDEITEHIVQALQVKLTGEERALAAAEKAPARNPEASEKIMRAMGYMGRESQDANLKARELLEQAATLDPQSARAQAALAKTYLSEVAAGWSRSPRESMEKAEAYAQKALALNDKVDFTHLIMGRVCLYKRQHDRAIQEAERAVALNAAARCSRCRRRAGRLASCLGTGGGTPASGAPASPRRTCSGRRWRPGWRPHPWRGPVRRPRRVLRSPGRRRGRTRPAPGAFSSAGVTVAMRVSFRW